MLTRDQKAGLDHGVQLFNREEYFGAHEALEDAWRESQEPNRTFLKGLIHAAVALYQYGRGNSHGARVKAASARRYLKPYAPEFEGLQVGELLADLARFVAPLEALARGEAPPPPEVPWPRIESAEPKRAEVCRPYGA